MAKFENILISMWKILNRYQHLKILQKITYKKKIVPTVDKNKMLIISFSKYTKV